MVGFLEKVGFNIVEEVVGLGMLFCWFCEMIKIDWYINFVYLGGRGEGEDIYFRF